MSNPLTSLDTARMANSDAAGADIQSKLGSLKMTQLSPEAKAKKLREACEGFESIFIQKMWQEMRKSVHQSTLLHSRDEQFWQDMYDQELAKKMSSVGGIGLADMMFEQLSSHLTSASRSTALTAQHERNFIPAQAPLLDNPLEKNTGEDLLAAPAPIYEKPAEPDAHSQESAPGTPLPPLAQTEVPPTRTQGVQNGMGVQQASNPKMSSTPPASSASPVLRDMAPAPQGKPPVQTTPASPVLRNMASAPQGKPPVQTQGAQAAAMGEKPSPWLLVEELQQKAARRPAGRNSVDNALAQMRAQVQAERILRPASRGNPEALAQVSYDELARRQQPVSSGIEMANVAKRQAGDQLGSRGIREPLLPQRQKAQDSVLVANTNREPRQNDGAVNVQPLPYSHPMNQAEMQDSVFSQQRPAPSSEAFVQNNPMVQQAQSPYSGQPSQQETRASNTRRVQRTNSDRRIRRQQKNSEPAIRTLNLDQPTGASLLGQPQVSEQNSRQAVGDNSFSIPPLTAMDLKS